MIYHAKSECAFDGKTGEFKSDVTLNTTIGGLHISLGELKIDGNINTILENVMIAVEAAQDDEDPTKIVTIVGKALGVKTTLIGKIMFKIKEATIND